VEEAPLVPLSTPEPEYIEEYSAPEPEINTNTSGNFQYFVEDFPS